MSDAPGDLNASLEIAADVGADLGEGPIWDDETATLLFVDSTIGRIYRLDPASGTISSVEVGQQIGAAIPRTRGGLVVSARDGLMSVDEEGRVALLLAVESERSRHRMNDAKCDSRGRLWSGTFSIDAVRKAGALYRVDGNLALTRVLDGISVSNGIAWSPDETKMYYVDTLTRGIDMFDYEVATGSATNRRRFVDIDRAFGLPDGITVDAEGHVWVALYLGGAVRRYHPDGRWVSQITVPVARVTSCGFGGPKMDELYITSANQLLVDDGRPHEEHAGALFRCRPGVRGLPVHRFAG